ncbi:MAG: aldolase/citrate lyase family protein, partial [Nanoarchaeota archaeon]|nr:aldolase/citrate lyase family protein [Nanoarchaeota archaeon]
RSIRRSLDQPELLKAEYEAIKRVHNAGYTKLGIMIPLVTDVEQVRKAKRIFKESTGLEPTKDIEFGIMVETPAAVQIIDELCQEGISFVSLGTNDLTQFTLACDRNSARVAKLYNELHPAVLRQIKRVIHACKRHNVKTSICGQAGSKPEMAKFLFEQGVDSISANPDAVYTIRKLIYKLENPKH